VYGKPAEKDKTPAPKDSPAPAGSGTIEKRGAEFVGCGKFPRIVPARDGGVHRLAPTINVRLAQADFRLTLDPSLVRQMPLRADIAQLPDAASLRALPFF
jgi:hypothetical protein